MYKKQVRSRSTYESLSSCLIYYIRFYNFVFYSLFLFIFLLSYFCLTFFLFHLLFFICRYVRVCTRVTLRSRLCSAPMRCPGPLILVRRRLCVYSYFHPLQGVKFCMLIYARGKNTYICEYANGPP